jgi:hypothetical protein
MTCLPMSIILINLQETTEYIQALYFVLAWQVQICRDHLQGQSQHLAIEVYIILHYGTFSLCVAIIRTPI